MSLTSDIENLPFELRESLAENRPRLAHSHSRQSIAASEGYYSLSDERASNEELLPPTHTHRYSTPPSRFHTPEDERGQRQPQDISKESRHFRRKAVGSGDFKDIIAGPAAEQKSLAWEKNVAGGDERRGKMEHPGRTYTPGQDDSQFIRFAIDQLTRDEEVRGSRHYPVRDSDEEGESSTSSELRAPLHGYGTYPTSGLPPPQQEPTHEIEHEHDMRDERRRPQTPLDIRMVHDDEDPVRLEPYPAGDDDEIREVPRTPDPIRQQRERELAEQKELQAGPAPAHPLEAGAPSASSSSLQPASENDVFVAYNPMRPTSQQPRLNFMPGILRPLWLGVFIFLCVLMLTGLIFCAAWCLTHDGLWEYTRFGGGRYFVFEYLPAMFGMFILVWLFQIEAAIIRVAPFMAMTSGSTKSRSEAQFLNLYPTQFLLPKLEYFRAGQPILGACFIIFWLFLFTIPLLGSSFNVGFFGPTTAGVWRWVAVQGVIWTVIILYILLVIALVLLLITLRKAQTGLKWDPRSLADLIALLERSNFLNEYTGTEIYTHPGDFRQRLWNSTPRMGYWHTSHRPTDIFYGMGEEGGLTRRYSIEQGRIREKGHRYHSSIDSHEDLELGDQSRVQLNYRHAAVRKRFIPWFLSSSSVLAWVLIAFVLLIAFYVVAFVNQATTDHGFLPQLRADTNSAGFSPANFVYSFIPGLIGLLLYLFWLPLDYTHRRLEPYRTMTTGTGATAEHSLLLDYPFRLPGSVTVSALMNRHWKIAFVSVMSIVNTTIPVLAGGIFWAQWYPNSTQVRISGEPAGLYALCVFLALYAVSLAALAPGRHFMRMPHESKTMAEVVSWLYQSPILLDRAFTRCQTKTELQTRLLGERAARPTGFWGSITGLVHSFSREGLRPRNEDPLVDPANRKAKAVLGADTLAPPASGTIDATLDEKRSSLMPERARYGFGVYTGRDGRDHLGIDKVGRGMVLFDE